MYVFKPLELTDIEIRKIADLTRIVFPKLNRPMIKYLAWLYTQNPEGGALGINVFHGSDLAAHYVTIPLIANAYGKPHRGLLSLNTITHPDHRGRDLFTRAAEKTYHLAHELGFEFVYGVANHNSTHGLVNKLGFRHLGSLDAKIGFGSVHLSHDHKAHGFRRSWSRESIQWRLASPTSPYGLCGKNGTYDVVSRTHISGVHAILERMSSVELATLDFTRLKMRSPFKVWLGIDDSINWHKSRYWDIPSCLRPSPLNFMFRDLRGRFSGVSRSELRIWAIDFDPF